MKFIIIAICLILAVQSRQTGPSQSSLSSQGTSVRGSTSSNSKYGASITSAGTSTGFGQSTGTSTGFGQSTGTSATSSRFGGSSMASSGTSGFGQSTGSSTGYGQSASSAFNAPPAAPSNAAPSNGASSANMDHPTFEQPPPGAPAAPQVPAMACFSADANRISTAKCPTADAPTVCQNMPNCVWGADAQTASAAASAAGSAAAEARAEAAAWSSRSSASGFGNEAEAAAPSTNGNCVWDATRAVEDNVAGGVDWQKEKCASYDYTECMEAANGLKGALCFWVGTTPRAETMLENVHRLVVGAMNARLSALDVILGVAFLITAAFGMHQFQQWWKTREHSKNGMAAKAEWHDQRMHIPIF